MREAPNPDPPKVAHWQARCQYWGFGDHPPTPDLILADRLRLIADEYPCIYQGGGSRNGGAS